MRNVLRIDRKLLSYWGESAARRGILDRVERTRRVTWPSSSEAAGPRAGSRVAIVVVNWNTKDLIAQLLFSICRVVGRDRFCEVVIVDNGSTDGSLEMLEALAEKGLIRLIANSRQRYHGPALNQGISWLAQRQRDVEATRGVDYVWVLDSDVVLLRGEVVDEALAHMRASKAVMTGQAAWDDYYQRDMLSLFSIMFDPARVWTSSLPPMQEDGAPSAALQLALDRARLPAVSFPFAADAYLIHLGRGTLARVAAAGDTENRYLRWAMTHTDPHFADAPAGPTAHARFVEIFERAIAELTPAQVAQACAEPGRVAIG